MPHRNPDEICGYCASFTRRDAEPQYTELGMGRCHGYDNGETSPVRYVVWSETCERFDKDSANVDTLRRFVSKCRIEGVPE